MNFDVGKGLAESGAKFVDADGGVNGAYFGREQRGALACFGAGIPEG